MRSLLPSPVVAALLFWAASASPASARAIVLATEARPDAAGRYEISVTFTEDVLNLRAESLIANGLPASSVRGSGPGPYVFVVGPLQPGAVVEAVLGGRDLVDAHGNTVSAEWTLAALASTTLSFPVSTSASPGSSVWVPISASPADGILGVDLTLNYDSAVIQATGASSSGIATSFGLWANLATPGTVVLSMYATQDPLHGSGEIARVQFFVSGGPGTSSALTFSSAGVNEGAIVPVFQAGAVIVPCAGAANGTPCNDGNRCTVGETCQSGSCTGGTPITAPNEVANLRIGPAKSALSWTPATGGAGTVHDILRGVVSGLPVGGASDGCFQSGVAAASTADPNSPNASTAFWYLVRGRNSCGTGTYGFAEVHGVPGAERLSSVCP